MKKITSLLLALLLVTTGCSAKDKKEETPLPILTSAINLQIGGEPTTLDPAFAVTPDEQSYIIHLYEGLTALSDTLEVIPAVAKSWTSETSETGLISYTFVLDPDAKWSDGQAVTAEDFIYSWTRTLDPATKSPIAYKLYPIQGAQEFHNKKPAPIGSSSVVGTSSTDDKKAGTSSADDKKAGTSSAEDKPELPDNGLGLSVGEKGELILTLEGDCPDLLTRLASPAWVPVRKSVIEANPEGWYYDSKTYISNGAYVLNSWVRDQRITLDRSKNYRKNGDVKAPKLNFVLSDDAEQMLTALTDGSVLLATTLPQLELEKAGDSLRSNVLLGSYSLVFNNDKSPFSDIRVRKALSMVLDRQALVAAMRDNSAPATALIPTGAVIDGVDLRKKGGDLLQTTANLGEAQKLLAEAGFEGGKGMPTISYLVNDQPAHIRMAENVSEAWKQLGITTELVPHKWDDYMVYREDGKFDVTHLSIFSDNLYPSAFTDSWLSDSPVNFAHYNSNPYDRLIDQGYGRYPRAPAEEDDKTDDTKAGTSSTDDKKAGTSSTDDKKAGTSSADDKKVGTSSTDNTQVGASDTEEPAKPVIDYLIDAEKLLVQQDCIVAPISWYTNSYLTANEGLTDFKVYPTGYMYFGQARYSAPTTAKK